MSVPGLWRSGRERLRFSGVVCKECGNLSFPARPCPECLTKQPEKTQYQLPDSAVVSAFKVLVEAQSLNKTE